MAWTSSLGERVHCWRLHLPFVRMNSDVVLEKQPSGLFTDASAATNPPLRALPNIWKPRSMLLIDVHDQNSKGKSPPALQKSDVVYRSHRPAGRAEMHDWSMELNENGWPAVADTTIIIDSSRKIREQEARCKQSESWQYIGS